MASIYLMNSEICFIDAKSCVYIKILIKVDTFISFLKLSPLLFFTESHFNDLTDHGYRISILEPRFPNPEYRVPLEFLTFAQTE